jgi:hypothetical protein
MSNKTKFTVNSSNGIKETNTNVHMVNCRYINPDTLEYITNNVIVTSKNITVFTKECHTIIQDIETLMDKFTAFDIDALIVGKFEDSLIISEVVYDDYAQLIY